MLALDVSTSERIWDPNWNDFGIWGGWGEAEKGSQVLARTGDEAS